MKSDSFRARWMLGILVLVVAFVASQLMYRSSISQLHGHLVVAARITEQMHASEKFHSAMHLMLMAATGYAETSDATFRNDFVEQQKVARTSLSALQPQAHTGATHVPGSGELERSFDEFSRMLEGVVATRDRGDGTSPDALVYARRQFDSTFSHFYAGLHQRHEADLTEAQESAHRIQLWTSVLFFAQLGLAALFGIAGLLYLDRIARAFLSVAEHLAITDGLTGAFNRRHLDTTLDEELKRAGRHERPLAIAMIDIDHFKRFNDTRGHQAGDRLLKDLTGLMQQNVRAEDCVARYGGEEFVIVFPETALDNGMLAAEKIRRLTEQRFVGSGAGAVTISIGLAAFPGDGASGAELIRAADRRLYRAKAEGRNRVVSSDEPGAASTAP